MLLQHFDCNCVTVIVYAGTSVVLGTSIFLLRNTSKLQKNYLTKKVICAQKRSNNKINFAQNHIFFACQSQIQYLFLTGYHLMSFGFPMMAEASLESQDACIFESGLNSNQASAPIVLVMLLTVLNQSIIQSICYIIVYEGRFPLSIL